LAWRGLAADWKTQYNDDIGGGSARIIARRTATLRRSFSRPLGACGCAKYLLKDDPPSPRQLHQMLEVVWREKQQKKKKKKNRA